MLILGFVVFVSFVGIGIVVPMFPFFGSRIGAPPEAITTAMAVLAFGQLISTPFWGWISDRIGRKPVLLISLFGSAIASLMLGWADSVAMLTASRLVAGLVSGIGGVAFAAVSDVSTGTARARLMGRVGAAFSLGFILGPALGGLVAGEGGASDYQRVALVVAALDVLAFALTLAFFRETRPAEARRREAGAAAVTSGAVAAAASMADAAPVRMPARSSESLFRIPSAVRQSLADRELLRLNIVNLLFSGSFAVVDTTLSLFANRAHGFSATEVGYMFTLMGVFTTIAQALLLGPLMRSGGPARAVICGVIVLGIGHVLVAISGSPLLLMAGALGLATGLGLFMAPSSSLVTARAGEHERGAILGVFQASGNVGRVLVPLACGPLFVSIGMSAPFIGGALLIVAALALLLTSARATAPAIE